MTLTDVPAPPPSPSRVRAAFDRVPTVAYLAFAAAIIVGIIALFGGLNDGQKTYATIEAGEVVDVGIADVTVDRVRLHATDFWGDPAEDGGEFVTIRMTVTNTWTSTFLISELITTGTLANPAYGVKSISIDEDVELDYPSIRTASGESSTQLGPGLTQTYDVTIPVAGRFQNRDTLSLVFAPSQYTPNKFLRDTSDGYYETLPTTAVGEFPIVDETDAP